jgi:hypothetical protein
MLASRISGFRLLEQKTTLDRKQALHRPKVIVGSLAFGACRSDSLPRSQALASVALQRFKIDLKLTFARPQLDGVHVCRQVGPNVGAGHAWLASRGCVQQATIEPCRADHSFRSNDTLERIFCQLSSDVAHFCVLNRALLDILYAM